MRKFMMTYLTVMLLVVAICTSCNTTEVEICYDETHPHLALVDLQYSWDEEFLKKNDTPDSMLVICHRVVNTWFCGYHSSTLSSDNKGEYIFNKPYEGKMGDKDVATDLPGENENTTDETVGVEDETVLPGNDVPASDTTDEETEDEAEEGENLYLKNGDYHFISYNYFHEDDTYEYLGLTSEEISEKVLNDRLLIKYKSYPLSDDKVDKHGMSWKDYNPYSTYITGATPVYYYSSGVEKIDDQKDNIIKITPNRLTQDIEIHFSIERDSVMIEKMMAEVSGVPESMNLITGVVDPSHTLKVLFLPQEESADGETSQSNGEGQSSWHGVTNYVGKISVMGLLRSDDPTFTTGAGIMQLAIFTYTEDKLGRKVSKLFNVGINLYNTIGEYGKIIYQQKETVILEIDNILKIDKNQVLETVDGDRNLDNWIIYKNIDLDV